VAREQVNESFGPMLGRFALPAGVWYRWETALAELYAERANANRAAMDATRRRRCDLETKEVRVISALLDGQLDPPTVKRIRARIAADRAEFQMPDPLPDFEHALSAGRRLAESPRATWDALRPEVRPGFLRVAFPERLDHIPESGFRTLSK
jgi:hypothetical protein